MADEPRSDEPRAAGSLADGELTEHEWVALNRRVALLTERAWYSGDYEAGVELAAIFDRWIRRFVRAAAAQFLGHAYGDYLDTLLTDAFELARTAVERGIEKPLGYVVRALRRKHRHELRRESRRRLVELGQPREGEWPTPSASKPDEVPSAAEARALEQAFRTRMHEWRVELTEKNDQLGLMISDLIEVCFRGHQKQREAYDTLGLTEAERKSAKERLARMRSNTNSKLHWLAQLVTDDDAEDRAEARFEYERRNGEH